MRTYDVERMRFKIEDLEVLFPYDYVYPEQLQYMTRLKQSLSRGHCVLEMPTGTGKTVTLLSLLLAYQHKHPEVGKIIYCTRTVHEMDKVIEELKRVMAYREAEIKKEHDEIRRRWEVYIKEKERQAKGHEAELAAGRSSLGDEEEEEEESERVRVVKHSSPSKADAMTDRGDAAVDPDAPIDPATLRPPTILGVCLSSRRNMCIHPVVSASAHRERVDSLCRSKTAGFVREQKLEALARHKTGAAPGVRAFSMPQSGGIIVTGSSGGPSLPSSAAVSDAMTAGPGCGGACATAQLEPSPIPGSTRPQTMAEVDAATASQAVREALNLKDIEDAGLCSFFEEFIATGTDAVVSGVYSLEDLKQLGAEKKWCPYFLTRRFISIANVVVYNYQYMLDPKISGMVSRDIERNSIVVFDEAHNIDNICIEALSITIDKPTVYAASRNLVKLQRLVQEAEQTNSQRLQEEYTRLVQGLIASGTLSQSVAQAVGLLGPAPAAAAAAAGTATTVTSTATPRAAQSTGGLSSVLQAADEPPLASPVLQDDVAREAVPGTIRRAKHFLHFLKSFVEYIKERVAGVKVVSQSPPAFMADFQQKLHLPDVTALKFAYDRLGMLMKTLQIADVDEYTPLTKITSFGALLATYSEGFVVLYEPFDDNGLPDVRLQLCCVDAALAIRPVFQKFRTVVITSGTLSPLDMYPKMLDFTPAVSESFTMSLARAIVKPMVVAKCSDQNPLSTRFSAREDENVARGYGRLVLQLCKNIPDGIVVFFTSYSYLEHMVEDWSRPDSGSAGNARTGGQNLSIMQQILQYKLVFLETKDIEETSLALAAYKKACACGRGAVFFSIARGKVAEGIDFSGHLGRAVVLIGVPFQYTRSRVLLARLTFLREKHQIADADFLNFDALRQASQCIGRIVRSKSDYGLIVFADQRYSRADKRSKLPRWVQQFMVNENMNLSTDAAIEVARNFLRQLAKPHDRNSELGVTLLDENGVKRYCIEHAEQLLPRDVVYQPGAVEQESEERKEAEQRSAQLTANLNAILSGVVTQPQATTMAATTTTSVAISAGTIVKY